jgi:hypothetical protein
MKKIFILFAFSVLFLVSCSKEDPSQVPIAQKPEDVYRSQAVTIIVNNINLTENEYQGNLDGVTVSLMKSVDNKLLFLLPSSTTLGEHTLKISSLKDMSVSYNVLDTTLSGTPEETLGSLFANLNSYSSSLDGSPESVIMQKNILGFKNFFDNSSLEDKTKIAVMYKANKTLFDTIFSKGYYNITGKIKSSVNGKISTIDLSALGRYQFWTLAMTGSAVIAIVADPVDKIIAALAVVVSASKALKAHNELSSQDLITDGFAGDGIDGVNNKVKSSALVFIDNSEGTIGFNSKKRKLIENDGNKSQTSVVSFFDCYRTYISCASKVNPGIEWVNSHIPFVNISLIPLATLPLISPDKSISMDSDSFKNVKFSIADTNLALVSATLASDGQVKMKIKFSGKPDKTPVQSYLNYSYNDEFTSFSGKLPISVDGSKLLGLNFENQRDIGVPCSGMDHTCRWEMKFSFSGDLTPIGGIIRSKVSWDSDADGIFDGDSGFSDISITSDKSNKNIVTNLSDFCWGRPTTILKVVYQYVSSSGIEGPIMETYVPR